MLRSFFRSSHSGWPLRKHFVIIVLFSVIFSSIYFIPGDGTAGNGGPTTFGHVNIPETVQNYTITFLETGLPSSGGVGTLWAVNLGGNPVNLSGDTVRSSSSAITFFRPTWNNYHYNISGAGGFLASTPTGTVVVNGADVQVDVMFSNLTHQVIFNETGINTNPVEPWSVNLTRGGIGINETSVTGTITFNVPDGPYGFNVTAPSGYYVFPEKGLISVQGYAYLQDVQFYSKLFSVTVNESGLTPVASGSIWSATLTNSTSASTFNITQSSHNSEISFMAPNGSYKLRISSPPNYTASPSLSYLNVTGQNYTQDVIFRSGIYTLEFSETGLPSATLGTIWGINLTNNNTHRYVIEYSQGTSILFNVTNGNYTYRTIVPDNYTAAPFQGTGYVLVRGGNHLITLSFSSLYFTVIFQEKGLPGTGGQNTTWSVVVNGISENSSSSAMYFSLPEKTGTYPFTILPVKDFTPSPLTGTITSPSPSYNSTPSFAYKNITFTYANGPIQKYQNSTITPLATLNFIESGLNAGQSWEVLLNNTTNIFSSSGKYSINSFSASQVDPKGTMEKFYFSVLPSGDFYPLGNVSNTIYWDGTNFENVTVNFRNMTHPVTFHESGLPVNARWNVTITSPGGVQTVLSGSGNPLTADLFNGIYHFRVSYAGQFFPGVFEGVFVVNNTSLNAFPSFNIKFSSDYYYLSFSETGLPSSLHWNISLVGGPSSGAISYSSFSFNLPNGTYYYAITGVQNDYPYVPSPAYGIVTVNGTQKKGVTITFTPVSDIVTFQETGLPAGSDWSATVEGVGTHNSGGTGSVSFSLGNGTYFYTTQFSSSYSSNRSSGVITVNMSQANVSISFHPLLHPIRFLENGLPVNASWTVILNNNVQSGKSGSPIVVNVTIGTYFYRLTSVQSTFTSNFTYFPFNSSGYINVTGASATRNIQFTNFTYKVPFEAQNLSSGSNFSVTFNGKTLYSHGSKFVNFTAQNGTYLFSVPYFKENISSPLSGSVTVLGQSSVSTLHFRIEPLYTVRFNFLTINTSALPAGPLAWKLRLSGPLPYNYNNTNVTGSSSSISFNLPNGSFSYQAYSETGNYSSPSGGTFSISGGTPSPVDLNFTEVTYAVTFSESNLPTGTKWSFTVNESGHSGTFNTTNSSKILQLHNGIYDYRYFNTTNFTISGKRNGNVSVNGTSLLVKANYTAFIYALTFRESGLPANTTWYVTLGSTTLGSGGSEYVNFSEANGTYSYYVAPYEAYQQTPSTGSITVDGNTSVSVAFKLTLYSVTFIENNLTSGTRWGVNVTGEYNFTNKSTTGNSITMYLANSSSTYPYVYHPYSTTPYFHAPVSKTFLIVGANRTFYANYTVEKFNVTFAESGLVAGKSWNITVEGNTYATSNSSISFMLFNGTYTYKYLNVSGYTIPTGQSGNVSVNGSAVKITVGYKANPTNNAPPPPPTTNSHPFTLPGYALVVIIAVAVVGAGIGAAVLMQRKKKE